jgi:cytochrome c556
MKHTLFGLLLVVASVSVTAQAAPQDIQSYRHEVYEGMAKHMKAMSLILKGKVDRPKTDVQTHAKALLESGKLLGDLFPVGTGPDVIKTDALATVWSQPDEFQAALQTYLTETTTLVELSMGDDREAVTAQFRKVGQSCGGCHETFRKDED